MVPRMILLWIGNTTASNQGFFCEGRETQVMGEDLCPVCLEPRFYQYIDFEGERILFRCQCEMDREKERVRQEKEMLRREEIRRLFAASKLGKRFLQASFDTFLPREGVEKARTTLLEYAEAFPREGGLFLFGPPGVGKTHLAAALSCRLLSRGFSVIFESTPELMYRFNATYKTEETELLLVAHLIDADLLVLDDFDKGKWSDKVEERLYVIVNGRYRECRPLCITTNLHPRDFQKLVGRALFDRLEETMEFLPLFGPSFRKGKEVFRV